jgi:hypothetical protein
VTVPYLNEPANYGRFRVWFLYLGGSYPSVYTVCRMLAHFLCFSFNPTSRHQYNARIVLLETRAFQQYPICHGLIGKSGMCSGMLQNTHNHHHNYGQRQRKWPPNAPNEASSPATTRCMDGRQPPKQAVIIFGGVRGVWPSIKVLLCSGNDALLQHWSVLRAMHPLNLRKIITACLGGLPPSRDDDGAGHTALCGVQGGHFRRRRPWLVMVEMVIVGRWRLVMSYFFNSHVDSIQS